METVSIDITRAKAIDGWMTEPELVWLAERAVEHRCIVEIGSHLGRSTRAMLDHTPGVVYAVDDWKGPRDVYMSKSERDGLFQKFLWNVKYGDNETRTNTQGKLCPIIRSHVECRDLDLIPDMVFIDGSHEYLDVKMDIEIWLEKICYGGLLCGHDAQMDSVRMAVSELLGDEVEVVDNTTIWWVVK